MVFVFLWLTSHNIVITRSIHVAANGIILLFFMTEYYSIVYMYHIFFIYSSVSEHLSWFHVLVIVSSAAMIFVVRVSFQIRVLVFSTCMLRSRISGPKGKCTHDFDRYCPLQVLHQFTPALTMQEYFCFPTSSPKQCVSNTCILGNMISNEW